MDLKRYFYKIYDNDGTYIKTQDDVVEKYPKFTMDMNGGVGSLIIRYARNWTDFYASTDLNLYNELRIIVDDDGGTQIYSGFISKVTLEKDDKGHEYVKATFFGYVSEFPVRALEFTSGANEGVTSLYYASETPEDILKDIIDKYDGKITYTASSVGVTGNTTTDLFNFNTIKDSIDQVITRCPIGWYWYVDGENIINLKSTNREDVDHTLLVGRQINQIKMSHSMENVINDVRLMGGTPDGEEQIYKKYKNSSSITEFGTRTFLKNDGRLYNNTSLDFVGKNLLGTHYSKEFSVQFDIMDDHIDSELGYDIESVKVGDIIQVRDPKHVTCFSRWDESNWDEDYWDYNKNQFLAEPVIVEEINYYGTGIRVKASRSIAGIGFRLADVKRNLDNYLNRDLAIDPTAEEEILFTYDDDGNLVGTTQT